MAEPRPPEQDRPSDRRSKTRVVACVAWRGWVRTIPAPPFRRAPSYYAPTRRPGIVRSSPAQIFVLLLELACGGAQPQMNRARRSSQRPGAARVANWSIPFVWIAPRTFWSAGRRSVQVSISAKSRTRAAFATMPISQEDSGIGLVMHRMPTSNEAVPLAIGSCAPVLLSIRHPLTTSSAQAALPSTRGRRTVRTSTGKSASWAHDGQSPITHIN